MAQSLAMTAISRLRGAATHSCGGHWRRLFSRSPAACAPLLGHFHHPTPTPPSPKTLAPFPGVPPSASASASASAPAFQPLTSSSPRLSLDFIPPGFSLFDSHLGLLVLLKETEPYSYLKHPQILVCDPVSRRTALLPPGMVTCTFSKLVSVVILSRDADGPAGSGLCFRAAVVTLEDTTLRAFVATFRDGKCHWECLLRSQARCNVDQLERHCVRASRYLIWHIRDEGAVLTFDPETLEFGFVLAPPALDMGDHFVKYRVGVMPDGRFCFGSMSMDHENLELRVLGPEPKDGQNVWVLEREVCLLQAFDEMPQLPSSFIARCKCTWLSDMDAGRTGRVFIGTSGYGHYSYHLDSRKLEPLVTDDGEEYGHPMFAYFSFPGSEAGSD
ncbi:unnamed protein product [Triticum turgidum subsp. durum]|uniref:Uncharacterized protein n=1 Tax=Triticum turgidum subsp. durum TaxID=4567 RepID=A0A9R0QAV2_TRITD|nr:unnamed protein product [Triticum turgidum subsp. durum]